MLKAAGAILVIFSCSAFGYSKSLVLSGRLRQLREIEKMVFLMQGLIRVPVFRRFSEKEQKPIWVIVHLRKKTWRNLYS